MASLKRDAFPSISVSGNRYESQSIQFKVGQKGQTLENNEQGYELTVC